MAESLLFHDASLRFEDALVSARVAREVLRWTVLPGIKTRIIREGWGGAILRVDEDGTSQFIDRFFANARVSLDQSGKEAPLKAVLAKAAEKYPDKLPEDPQLVFIPSGLATPVRHYPDMLTFAKVLQGTVAASHDKDDESEARTYRPGKALVIRKGYHQLKSLGVDSAIVALFSLRSA